MNRYGLRRLQDGSCTDASYATGNSTGDLHPFISCVLSITVQQGQAGARFFKPGSISNRIYPRYRRAGAHQAVPAAAIQTCNSCRAIHGFREMIIEAAPGLLAAAVSITAVLELCTLAQVCLRRYGQQRTGRAVSKPGVSIRTVTQRRFCCSLTAGAICNELPADGTEAGTDNAPRQSILAYQAAWCAASAG